MKAKKISDETTNRGEFNRAYKRALEHTAKIHCDRCRYHRGENYSGKYYGGRLKTNGHLEMRFPNWKLVSKNPKQWMKKPIKIITRHRLQWFGMDEWYDIKFPA